MVKGYKKSDLENLPACATDFIKQVIKKMRYRKKVRADVMVELASHFEDELKDCKTGEEKEQKAQQLIDEFGDVKLLAVLLRRAKKRCRPLWRKAVVRSFQTLGIIVLYFLICSSRFLIGTPTISVNYIDWLNDMVRAGRDESENARPYYEKATELYVKMPEWLSTSKAKWPDDFNDVEMRMLLKWLGDNKQMIETLRKAAYLPYYWNNYKDTTVNKPNMLLAAGVMNNVMEHLSVHRSLAYAMQWQIRYEAYNGEIDRALNDCIVLQKFGSFQHGQGLLIEQLVGIAISRIGHNAIFMILEKVDVPVETLKKIQQSLEERFYRQEPIVNLQAEKAFWYDFVQRGFTDDGKGGGRVLKWGLPLVVKDAKSSIVGFFFWNYPDRRQVVAIIDSYYEQAGQLFDTTPWQLHNEGFSDGEMGKELFMLKMLGPAHSKISQISGRLKAVRAALVTVLAVLRFEKEKGQYPEKLQGLVKDNYLKELPMDPWSDEPLIYKKTDDNFILYSIGFNFRDDGGKVGLDKRGKVKLWADEGDAVFWPIQKN